MNRRRNTLLFITCLITASTVVVVVVGFHHSRLDNIAFFRRRKTSTSPPSSILSSPTNNNNNNDNDVVQSLSREKKTITTSTTRTKKKKTTKMDILHDDDDNDYIYDNLKNVCIPVMDSFGRQAWEYRRKKKTDSSSEHFIRFPATVDDDVKDLSTREQIWLKIRQVQENQTKVTGYRSDLYKRTWSDNNEEEEMKEAAGVNGLTTPKSISFTVLQFNTLAQGLSSGSDVKPPFFAESTTTTTTTNDATAASTKKDDDSTKVHVADTTKTKDTTTTTKDAPYGGFSNLIAPNVSLDFQQRKWRLLQVILGGGVEDGSSSSQLSNYYDIIGLEECDSYHSFFQPTLAKFDYDGIWMPKPYSPGVRKSWYSDGCALFWNKNKWECMKQRKRPIGSSGNNQVVIMAVLRNKLHPSTSIMIVVTHLKASLSYEKTRIEQAKWIMEWIHHEKNSNTQQKQYPVILLGDFNSPPPTSLKSFTPSCLGTFLKKQKNMNGFFKFQSAYNVHVGLLWNKKSSSSSSSQLWTTWKTRGEKTVKRMIDYILYGSNNNVVQDSLNCTATLNVPTTSDDDEELMPLPSLRYPSDHVAIAAKFELSIKDNDNDSNNINDNSNEKENR